MGGWFSSLETFLSPSPGVLCLQKIAQCCNTSPKSTPREQRHVQLLSQTWFTAPLPSTSVPIAFWLCTDAKANIDHKNTIPVQAVTGQRGLVCLTRCREGFCFMFASMAPAEFLTGFYSTLPGRSNTSRKAFLVQHQQILVA